jgi:hypothetical protein
MTAELTCWSCGNAWDSEDSDCPVSCPVCLSICCPECGGEMGRSIDDGEDMDSYTAGGCHRCNHQCCGDCI